MISKDSSHKRTSGSLFLSVTSWTSRGGDPVSDHHLMTAGPLKVSPLMGGGDVCQQSCCWHLDHLSDHLLTWWNIQDSSFHAAEAISIRLEETCAQAGSDEEGQVITSSFDAMFPNGMMEPREIRLSSSHLSKFGARKRAWRIVTCAEKVIGCNWASLRALQQPPEIFLDVLE